MESHGCCPLTLAFDKPGFSLTQRWNIEKKNVHQIMFLTRALSASACTAFSKECRVLERCKLASQSKLIVPGRTYSALSGKSKPKDLYAVMGVTPNATQQQIKEAYYELSMKYHPDKNRNSKEAHAKFTELTEAYSVLGSHDLRKRYDKGLLHTHPHRHTHSHTAHESHAGTKFTGPKVKFDFDEFYRAHYGEALKREQEARRSRAEARERAKVYTISQNIQQLLIVTVVMGVLLVGWYSRGLGEREVTSGTKDQSEDRT